MIFLSQHILTLTLFTPLLGIIPLILLPQKREKEMRVSSLILSLIPLGLSLMMFHFHQGTGELEFQSIVPWLKGYKVYYRVGVDGLSLPLIVLTSLLMPLVLLQSWKEIQSRVREFLFFLHLLQTGMIGVFVSVDLFLFYVFWEATLIPMYFLIGIWGGPRRIYSAIKFVLYTLLGSLLMLAGILYLYFAGNQTFNILELYDLSLPLRTQAILFAAFAFAFAIKIPLFPFHTWLPDAHVEAPTGGSVFLAAILLKMGTYGFLRLAMPLFPEATAKAIPILLVLSTIGIVYGALVSMVQQDIKKLVAFTSVSHLGFVMLGLSSLTPEGVAGAALQMINHGISTGCLFLLVGMLYERRHTRKIDDFGGLASVTPVYALLFLMVGLSSIALPGTNGFVGEFLILLGTFRTHPVFASVAAIGVVFGAVTILWMVQRVFFGPVTHEANKDLPDLSTREVVTLLPLVVLIFWIGLAPGFLLKKMEKSVVQFTERVSLHGKIITD